VMANEDNSVEGEGQENGENGERGRGHGHYQLNKWWR
jgi:hypothetical protein